MAPSRSGTLRSKSSSVRTANRPHLHSQPNTPVDELIAFPYEQALPAKKPLAVTVPPPRAPPSDTHPALRVRPHASWEDDKKRDSGLAPTTSSKAREGSVNTVEENVLGVPINFNSPPPVPTLKMSLPAEDAPNAPISPITPTASREPKSPSSVKSFWKKATSVRSVRSPAASASPASQSAEGLSLITTAIPTESLLEEGFLSQLSFSKRGSVMLGGKKAVNGHLRPNGGRRLDATEDLKRNSTKYIHRQPSISMLATPTIKILPEDVEKQSQKVRSMYEKSTTNLDWNQGASSNSSVSGKQANGHQENLKKGSPAGSSRLLASPDIKALYQQDANSNHSFQSEADREKREQEREYERAGGIENWEDVDEGDVDRYGFINLRRRPGTPEPRPVQRVSTLLMLASETPRQKRFGRSPSAATSARSRFSRAPSRRVSARSVKTQGSVGSNKSTGRAQLRAAANRLPGNQDRRWMDEAGDMLTLPPGLADIAEDEEGGKAVAMLKKKEMRRAEKWRKMAKINKRGKDGHGMEFEFNTSSPKLIERTWKGIPDVWRGPAWLSFLTTSAKKRSDFVPDEDIKMAFHRLQQESSVDDVQIDIDVPRTINSHIMFRRRYRGGQRLLFRVLHAVSLYFPETGYVQGMASLAATLLCYYDEDTAFVMMVRMWKLRGLAKLYEPGFPGLMAALDEFKSDWLKGREVSEKMDDLTIEATAYGTRWYLTLFNYSIPFPAQLRVWDIFMLLGDSDPSITPTKERPFAGGLDIIHATSAALIDGTREILLDSDFENGMKVLTSWIPVKDEELLMRVTKAEWKLHRGGKRRS
ncbi:hypothetical protein HYFRA_00006051 [Hymenoscyphus fraxineus]|uniref:Rab-GAP TBC domain-containing protein n=1 Tax=Hymenoscyphus fraxineus TaxID=746836 RepID=A0A9N9PIH1_9HELO|nr:hypothetical protein HYFRA_00006051 [Hymenoscyphus fraxineus]